MVFYFFMTFMNLYRFIFKCILLFKYIFSFIRTSLSFVNLKYLSNVFLYFFSVFEVEYLYWTGFYYLVQDYYIVFLPSAKELRFFNSWYFEIDPETQEDVKISILLVVYITLLF